MLYGTITNEKRVVYGVCGRVSSAQVFILHETRGHITVPR